MDLGSVYGRLGFQYDDRDLRKAERDLEGYADTSEQAGRSMREMADDSKRAEKGLTGIRGAATDADKGLRDTADGARDAGAAMDDVAGKTGGLAGALAGLAGQGEGALGSMLGKVGDLDLFGTSLGDIAGKASDLLPKLAGGGGLSGGMSTLAASINPVTIAAAAAGAALLKMAQVGIKAAGDMNNAQRTAQAQFGLTAAEAEALADVGAEVFANNWAGSIDEATESAGRLRVAVGDISDEDLIALTESAAALESAFEIPQEETAKMLQGMKQFGLEGTEAIDLVTVAIQKSAEPADEAIATFHEYSTNFANMGFTAEEMTAIMVSGAEAGAFSMDKVGDAVKEMGVMLSAGSDGTRDWLDELSPGLSGLVDQFNAGKISGKEAFEAIQLAMENYEGQINPDMLANIFGSPGEDLSKEIVMAFDTSTAALGDWQDSAMAAGNATLTVGDSWQSVKNQIAVGLGEIFEPLTDAVGSRVKPALDSIAASFAEFRQTDTFELLKLSGELFARVIGRITGDIIALGGIIGDVLSPVGGWIEDASSGFLKAAEFVGLVKEDTEEMGVAQQEAAGKVDENAQALIDQSAAAAAASEAEVKAAEAALLHADALEEATQTLNDRVHGALSDLRTTQLNYARDIQAARAKDAADSQAMRDKVAEGEADHVEKMAKLNEKLHNSEGDAQAKAAEQIAAEQERWSGIVAEAEAGTQAATAAVEQRYDEERLAVRNSLAQTVVDHTNAMVLMDEVSDETAKAVFGALSEAYPDVEVINPATEATLEFNATLNDVLSGEKDASAIVDAIDNVETAMLDSEALNAEEWGIENAFDRAGLSAEEMYTRIGASADGVGSDTEAMEERVGTAHGDLVATMTDSGGAAAMFADQVGQQGKRVVDDQSGMADGVRSAQERVRTEFSNTEGQARTLASGVVSSLSGIGDAVAEDKFSGLMSLETNLQAAEAQSGSTARSIEELNAATAELKKPAEDGGTAFDRTGRDIEESATRGVRALGETKGATDDLGKAIDDLPEEIEVDMAQFLKQLDSSHTGLRRLITDIGAARAAGIEGVPIRAWIQTESPGADDGGSIMYQHFIEDARAEGERGIGIRAWMDTDEALQDAEDMLDYARQLQELIDGQAEALDDASRDIADAEERAADAASSFTRAIMALFGDSMEGSIGGAHGEIGGFLGALFQNDRWQEVLKRVPEAEAMLNDLRDAFDFGAGFFEANQILDPKTLLPFESVEQFQAKLEELEDQPEKQRELWDQFSDAAGEAFTLAGDSARQTVMDLLDAIGPNGIDQLREDFEGDIWPLLGIIDQWSDRLNDKMGDQIESVDAQAEAYDRLLDLIEDRRAEEQEILKALEDQIKKQEREQLDAEREIHDQTMELLEAEEERLEEMHDDRMARLDARLEREKEAMDLAEEEHKRRMDMLDEETERLEEQYDLEQRSLSDAKAAIAALEDGFELTDYERSALEAMGFDPDELKRAVEESKKLQEEVKGLQDLVSDLGDDRKRLTKDDLTQAQRDRLQEALDSGAISDPDERRRIEVLLNSKGGIATGQVRGILERLSKSQQDAGSADAGPGPLDAVEERIRAREREQEILKHSIDEEKRAADELKAAEEARWEQEEQGFLDRIAAIEATKAAEEARFEAQQEAIRQQMELQKEAHDERMRQIQEEYALELLRLGEGEEAVRQHLERQRELARQIADEAQRRHREAMEQAERDAARGGGGVAGTGDLIGPPPGSGAVAPDPGSGLVRRGPAIGGPSRPFPGGPGGGIGIPVPGPGTTSDSSLDMFSTAFPGAMSQTNAELQQMIDLSVAATARMDDLRRSIGETVGGETGRGSGGGGDIVTNKTNSENVTLYGNIISTDPEGRALIERLLEALGAP